MIDLQTGLSTWSGERLDAMTKQEPIVKHQTETDTLTLREQLRDVDPLHWKARYNRPNILDGTHWNVTITTQFRTPAHSGSNAYPRTWAQFSAD